MIRLTDKLAIGVLLVLAVLGWTLAGVQSYRLYTVKIELAEFREQVGSVEKLAIEAVAKEVLRTGVRQATQSEEAQENVYEFGKTENVRLLVGRDELDRANRLRSKQTAAADGYRTLAETCAASKADIVNKLETLDGQLREGVEVVGALGNDLRRRDGEVVLLDRHLKSVLKLYNLEDMQNGP